MCDRPYPSNDLQVFYESVKNTYNPQNAQQFELPEAILLAIGRLGVRLMKYLTSYQRFNEAFNVLRVLHDKAITYATCGAKFGTSRHTDNNMSTCEIANLCSNLCNIQKSFESAVVVLSHCSYGEPTESEDIDQKEIVERNGIAKKIVEGLIKINQLKDAWEVFNTINRKDLTAMSPQVQAKLANDLCCGFCKMNYVESAYEVFNFIQARNISEQIHTTKAYINCLASNNKRLEALQIFKNALANNVYDNTYSNTEPLLMNLPTDLTDIELTFMIENHLNELRSHHTYGQDTFNLPDTSSQVLQILVSAQENDSPSNAEKIEKQMHAISKILRHFNPPLQVIAQMETVSS